jgi:hypothetical protein
MTVLIMPLASPYVRPRYVPRFWLNWNAVASLAWSAHDGSLRADSMKFRRSAGSPAGSAWPFLVQVRSNSLTLGTSPRSSSEATSGSASASHTHRGSAPSPAPAIDPWGDHVHSEPACAGVAALSAPSAPNAPPPMSTLRLLGFSMPSLLLGAESTLLVR